MKYTAPEMELVMFETEEVVAASTNETTTTIDLGEGEGDEI